VPESANSSLTPLTYALASLFVSFALVPLASGRRVFLRLFALLLLPLFVSCLSYRRLIPRHEVRLAAAISSNLSYRRRLAGAFAVASVAPPFRAAGFTFFSFRFRLI